MKFGVGLLLWELLLTLHGISIHDIKLRRKQNKIIKNKILE